MRCAIVIVASMVISGCTAQALDGEPATAVVVGPDMAGPRFYYDVAIIVIADCVQCHHDGTTPPHLSPDDNADNGINFDALHAIADDPRLDEMIAKYAPVGRDAAMFNAWRTTGAQR